MSLFDRFSKIAASALAIFGIFCLGFACGAVTFYKLDEHARTIKTVKVEK